MSMFVKYIPANGQSNVSIIEASRIEAWKENTLQIWFKGQRYFLPMARLLEIVDVPPEPAQPASEPARTGRGYEMDESREDFRQSVKAAKLAIQDAKDIGADVTDAERLLGEAVGYSYRLDFAHANQAAMYAEVKAVKAYKEKLSSMKPTAAPVRKPGTAG